MSLWLPTICTVIVTIIFLVWERVVPGRELPNSKNWYARVLFVNALQIGITFGTNKLWFDWLSGTSLFHIANWNMPVLQGFVGWLISTFFFYWWHRIRHANGFWVIFHQVHHSPARIEALTSFYKHPVEILSDSFLIALLMYPFLGASLEGAFWLNFFAATGEYFYHSNIKSPKWMKHFIQTPELHSIHHQLDVHKYNYSDLPIWDKLFGTYKDTDVFMDHCGFPRDNERKLWKMMVFKDVYNDEDGKSVKNESPKDSIN
jgi:sterol desaturase/sphingolipid hydroxylase (fatty acid hydroxylase superfamily)